MPMEIRVEHAKRAVLSRFLMVLITRLDHTARKPKVTLEAIADPKPSQLKLRACIEAGPAIVFSSSFVMGRPKEAFLNPAKYMAAQYAEPMMTCTVETVQGKGKYLKMLLFRRLNPTFRPYHTAMKPSVVRAPPSSASPSPERAGAGARRGAAGKPGRRARCWAAGSAAPKPPAGGSSRLGAARAGAARTARPRA